MRRWRRWRRGHAAALPLLCHSPGWRRPSPEMVAECGQERGRNFLRRPTHASAVFSSSKSTTCYGFRPKQSRVHVPRPYGLATLCKLYQRNQSRLLNSVRKPVWMVCPVGHSAQLVHRRHRRHHQSPAGRHLLQRLLQSRLRWVRPWLATAGDVHRLEGRHAAVDGERRTVRVWARLRRLRSEVPSPAVLAALAAMNTSTADPVRVGPDDAAR